MTSIWRSNRKVVVKQVAHVYIPVSTISRPVLQSDNTLKPRQNDQHFADDMFKNVFPILISI